MNSARRSVRTNARTTSSTQLRTRLTIGDLLAAACDAVGPGPDVGLRVSRLLTRGPIGASLSPRLVFGRK